MVLEHVHSMLQLLRCVVNRDWGMINTNHAALAVLFPGYNQLIGGPYQQMMGCCGARIN